jgi:hypothetical protein
MLESAFYFVAVVFHSISVVLRFLFDALGAVLAAGVFCGDIFFAVVKGVAMLVLCYFLFLILLGIMHIAW